MGTYMFSVIIPHYRDLDSIQSLIDSIPRREDIQIIIVDDNSFEDRSIVDKVIRDFNRDNLILKYNEVGKRGAGSCRNIGIDVATGKWLVFADADDLFVKNAFDVFDREKESDADIIYFSMTSINLPSGEKGTRHLQYVRMIEEYLRDKNPTNELNIRYNYPSPCGKMVKQSMVKENHIIYDDTRWANDDMFATKCGFYASKIDVFEDKVYCITRKNGSITTQKSEEVLKTKLDVHIRKMLFLKDHLSKDEFHNVTRWPGNKIITTLLEGYGCAMVKYIIKEYRKNSISLLWINRSDVDESWIKIKSWISDRKYKRHV